MVTPNDMPKKAPSFVRKPHLTNKPFKKNANLIQIHKDWDALNAKNEKKK